MARPAAAAALLLAVSLLPLPAPAQETDVGLPTPWLSRARVTATVAGARDPAGTARLEATYSFRPGLDTARLSAGRVANAAVELVSVAGVSAETPRRTGRRWRLDSLPGLLRLRIADPPDTLSLEWRVRGDGRRLPLFVPETPTRPTESRVLLEVRGGDLDVAVDRVFPRMERAGGVLVGRPENLPAFLLLPPGGQLLTVDRAADWSVVLLVLVATGWWAVWRRRESGRADAAGEDAPAGPAGGRERGRRRGGE